MQFTEKAAPVLPKTSDGPAPTQSVVTAPESALVTRDGKTVAFEILEGRVKLRQVEVSSKKRGVARIKRWSLWRRGPRRRTGRRPQGPETRFGRSREARP